ncbi:RNA-binding protein [Candidatus Roizmanbacteria bacterium]|nr:RNA-binding protein [Candidatus Roizmanbacteria bacterium]
MSKKIYIGRISTKTTEEKLAKHFSQIGKIVSLKIVQGINPSKHAGYGYIVMNTEEETHSAINKLNNSNLDGSTLKVMEAHFLDQDKKPDYYYRRHK